MIWTTLFSAGKEGRGNAELLDSNTVYTGTFDDKIHGNFLLISENVLKRDRKGLENSRLGSERCSVINSHVLDNTLQTLEIKLGLLRLGFDSSPTTYDFQIED